jgi:hypothetical protein
LPLIASYDKKINQAEVCLNDYIQPRSEKEQHSLAVTTKSSSALMSKTSSASFILVVMPLSALADISASELLKALDYAAQVAAVNVCTKCSLCE